MSCLLHGSSTGNDWAIPLTLTRERATPAASLLLLAVPGTAIKTTAASTSASTMRARARRLLCLSMRRFLLYAHDSKKTLVPSPSSAQSGYGRQLHHVMCVLRYIPP